MLQWGNFDMLKLCMLWIRFSWQEFVILKNVILKFVMKNPPVEDMDGSKILLEFQGVVPKSDGKSGL